jgi:hypothetical protein
MNKDPIYIGIAVEEGNRTVYCLVFQGKTISTHDTAASAIKARTKLEREIKQEGA